MRFSKWHALGNAYLVVEQPAAGPLTASRVSRLCDVNRGIGSNGVLEIVSSGPDRACVVIWNPDGSVAEMSGNGTRIAAAWLFGKSGSAQVSIETHARVVETTVRGDGSLEQRLGVVAAGAQESLELNGTQVELVPVDVGNPHAVITGVTVDRTTLLRLGPLIETHAHFPVRTNVQLARVDGPHEITALVWERGVGETAASGSSAVAVAAAAVAQEWCATPVIVHFPGGDLEVRIADDGAATLIGPAEEICRGETDL